jgi:hypothetical protein
MMEEVHTSETSVCLKEITRCYIPEGYHFHRMEVLENRVLRRISEPKRE